MPLVYKREKERSAKKLLLSKRLKFIMPVFMSLVICICMVPMQVNATATAGTSKSYTESISISAKTYTATDSNVALPFDVQSYETSSAVKTYTYYYLYDDSQLMFTPSATVYGYKMKIVSSDISASFGRVSFCRMAVGNIDDLASGSPTFGGVVNTSSSSYSYTIFYLNEYSTASLYLAPYFKLFEVDTGNADAGTSSSLDSYVDLSGTFTITVTPYTMEESFEEITTLLEEQLTYLAENNEQNAEIIEQNEAIKTYLDTIAYYTTTNNTLLKTYLPQLVYMLEELEAINTDLDTVISKLTSIITKLSNVVSELEDVNSELDNISSELAEITGSSSSDSSKVDSFADDSNSQSSSLNDLNTQTRVERIDVDSASADIDSIVDVNAASNYGLLLSAFTSNERIVGMILVVLACGLLSYVFFGKR